MTRRFVHVLWIKIVEFDQTEEIAHKIWIYQPCLLIHQLDCLRAWFFILPLIQKSYCRTSIHLHLPLLQNLIPPWVTRPFFSSVLHLFTSQLRPILPISLAARSISSTFHLKQLNLALALPDSFALTFPHSFLSHRLLLPVLPSSKVSLTVSLVLFLT